MTVLTRALAVVGALALGLGGALVVAAPAAAANAPIVVKNNDTLVTDVDSLPWAIAKSNTDPGADTILFDMATVTSPLVLASDLDDITDDLTIAGPGQGVLTIDAPGTVFEIVGTTPAISVAFSDITITSAAASACGISSDDADVTVTNVTASDFDCSGVSVTDGSLTATDVTVERDATGIAFAGSTSAHSLTLTRINADGADFTGVNAVVTGGAASVADVQADDSALLGFYLATTSSGTSTISGVRADRSGIVGITVIADDSATATLTDSSAADSDGQGIYLQADDHSSLTATGITSLRSAATGLWLSATGSASLAVQSSTIQDTVDYSGVWVDQVAGGSSLRIAGTTITGNYSNDDGGGVDVNALKDDGTSLTISDSTVSSNTSVDFGGGIYLRSIGGGVTSTAKVVIERTTFDSNYGGGYGAGIAINDPAAETTGLPTVLIDSSTFMNNTTPYGGGGIHIRRTTNGAPAVVKILNTTVTGNDAQTGGGVDVSANNYGTFGGPGSPYVPGPDILTTVISHSTIANNSAHTSAGVAANSGDHRVEIDNSILSGGTSNNGGTVDDLDPSPTFALSYSLVEAPRSGTVIPAGVGNLTALDPKLGPLANNGGTTLTRLISPGSPAYNAGDPAFAGTGLLDQRGQARVYQVVDMGAVEWQPALAHTGVELTPGPPLMAFLLLFAGTAMVAFSRLRTARSLV